VTKSKSGKDGNFVGRARAIDTSHLKTPPPPATIVQESQHLKTPPKPPGKPKKS